MTYDVIIIGGGVVSAASALELSKAGLKVLVLEKTHVGAGASGASAALLEFQIDAFRGEPFFSLAKASRPLFPALADEIKDISSIDIQYEPCGILQLALTDEDVTALQAEIKRQTHLGLRGRWLSADHLQENLPQLNETILGGAFFEEDGQVNGEKFLRGLMKAAVLKGATLVEDLSGVSFKHKGNRVTQVITKENIYDAAHVVVAAGAWSDDVLSLVGLKCGVEPVKGQLAVFDTPRRPLPFPIYTRHRGYIACKQDGYSLAGSTVERVGFSTEASEETRRELATRAIQLVPQLAKAPLRPLAIAGLRPGSPDELPFLGSFPEMSNLTVATGHFRNGILLAPITGRIVAALITNTAVPVDIAPFRPDRFSVAAK
jgi:glycine oxidase